MAGHTGPWGSTRVSQEVEGVRGKPLLWFAWGGMAKADKQV